MPLISKRAKESGKAVDEAHVDTLYQISLLIPSLPPYSTRKENGIFALKKNTAFFICLSDNQLQSKVNKS